MHRRARRRADRVPAQRRTASWPTTRRSRSPTGSAGELDLPVFMYGELASAEERRERAFFREGGVSGAAASRDGTASWSRTSGRRRLHPTAGATLVTARPPLVAFNVELDTSDVELAKAVAARGARGRRRPAGRARDRRDAGFARRRAGLHQRARSAPGAAARGRRGGQRARRSRWERASPALRSSASRRRRRSTSFPADVPLNGFDQRRHVLEQRMRLRDQSLDGRLDGPSSGAGASTAAPRPAPSAATRSRPRSRAEARVQRAAAAPAPARPAAHVARGVRRAGPIAAASLFAARDAAPGRLAGGGDRAGAPGRAFSTSPPSTWWTRCVYRRQAAKAPGSGLSAPGIPATLNRLDPSWTCACSRSGRCRRTASSRAADGSDAGGDLRPGRRAGAHPGAGRANSASRSRRSSSPTLTSTTSAQSRRWRARPARPCT